MKLTNKDGLNTSMAVFLATDDYDYDPRPNAFSATSLLRSTRQIILSERVSSSDMEIDISTLIASRFGGAIHDGVERCWLNPKTRTIALRKLGFSDAMIKRVIVNPGYKQDEFGNWVKDPDAKPMKKDAIPVYVEIRNEIEIEGMIVSGKFDFIGDGELEDHKTTGVFTFIKKTNDEKFRMQGSIYRLINPDLITSDRMYINYSFTDWSALREMIERKSGYPPRRMMSVPLTLKPVDETKKFVTGKLREIKHYIKADESALPACTKEELWQENTVYKYYKNPKNKTRATKNFDNFAEAQQRLIKDGNVGEVSIVKGQAKACRYCKGFPLCSQAQQLIHEGLLEIEA